MTVRAKMKCMGINHAFSHNSEDIAATVILQPVWTGEDGVNKEWSRNTPSGRVEMLITNPKAVDGFEIGRDYFVDFSPAD